MPIGFSSLPITDLNSVYPVAATMVGIDKKNEDSNAEALDIPANCPPAIVDIDREVPVNAADIIWQAPIQIAWPRLMSSILQVRMRPPGASGPAASERAFIASTVHITIP